MRADSRGNILKIEDYTIIYDFAAKFVQEELEHSDWSLNKVEERLEQRWYNEIPNRSFEEWYPLVSRIIQDYCKNNNLTLDK